MPQQVSIASKAIGRHAGAALFYRRRIWGLISVTPAAIVAAMKTLVNQINGCIITC